MGRKRWGSSLLLVLLASTPAAARNFLVWDFPRAYSPVPAFLIVVEGKTGSTTMTVPASPRGACATLPTATTDAYCAELPCPGVGVWTATVYAWWAGEALKSGPSNSLTFQIRTGPQCLLVPVTPGEGFPPGPPPAPCARVTEWPPPPPPPTVTVPTQTEITVDIPTPRTTVPPAQPTPRIPHAVLTTAPTIVARVAAKPVRQAGDKTPVTRTEVYAGPPTEVPLPDLPQRPVVPPCPQ